MAETNTRRPEGVVEKKGRWYYRPTSARERAERAVKGLPETVPLGRAGTIEARMKWAELTGCREPQSTTGTVGELLAAWARLDEKGIPAQNAPLRAKDNGKPRADGTIKQYAWTVRKQLLPRFAHMRYGKTAIDAARGAAIGTVDVQRFIADVGTTSANVAVGCLSSVFMWAIRNGRTTYNPCEGVAKIAQEGSTREPKPWEVECLGAMAEALGRRRMALMIDYESISGWRCVDMRKLRRRQLTPEGIRHHAQKNGARQLLVWTPDLRRIIAEALELPGARRAGQFPLSPVFANRGGGELSGGAFWDAFRLLLQQTNEALAECEIPLKIEPMGFHALRSKAGDDAEEDGRQMHEFLGNTAAVARKHYARRERKVVPLSLKRA
jgi:hypothetical protein